MHFTVQLVVAEVANKFAQSHFSRGVRDTNVRLLTKVIIEYIQVREIQQHLYKSFDRRGRLLKINEYLELVQTAKMYRVTRMIETSVNFRKFHALRNHMILTYFIYF